MSSTSELQRLTERLTDPQSRSRMKLNQSRELIASQIRLLREKHHLTQAGLGSRVGIPQPRISLLEDPDYAGITLKTLAKLSDAFDVGLIVRFAPFSEIVQWMEGLTPERLTPPSYDEERQLPVARIGIRSGYESVTVADSTGIQIATEPSGTASLYVPPGYGELYEEQKSSEPKPEFALAS